MYNVASNTTIFGKHSVLRVQSFILVLYPTRSVGLQGSSVLWLRRLALPPPKIAAARRVCSCPTLANSLAIIVLHFVWLRLENLWVPSFGECSMVVRKVRACILSSISLRCWCQLVGYNAIWALLWLTVQTFQYLHFCQKFVIEICSSFRLLVLDMASMVSR